MIPPQTRFRFAQAGLFLALAVPALRAQCAHLDDPLQVLDFYLEMDPADWQLLLFDNDFQDDGSGATERPGVFRCGNEAPLPCRVRRKKGAAIPSEAAPVKVSLKIDFNDDVRNGHWYGYRKLSLENGQGGVLLSEGLSWQLLRQSGVITSGSSWVRVHLNGQPLGIYTRVEQVDRQFLRRHLSEDDGYLYKNGERETRVGEFDPYQAALCYPPFGSGCEPPDGYAGLAELCDLRQLLGLAAVDAFLSNWDSAFGNGNNFWHYHSGRPRLHFPWDVDRGLSPDPRSDPRRSPFDLVPEILAYDVLFADPGLRAQYQAILGRLAADPFRPEVLDRLIDEVLAAVGPAISGDPLNDLPGGLEAEALRLRNWIRVRHQTVVGQLPVQVPPPVVINEVLPSNLSSGRDETGQANDWLELYNRGVEPVSLLGLFLSDDRARPLKWLCPEVVLAPGERVLIWCDGHPEQGPLHANFRLDGDGEGIGLYSLEGETPRVWDYLRYRPLEVDRSVGRFPDGAPGFRRLPCPSPGTPNRESCEGLSFRRGDADLDGVLSVTDAVRILSALFFGQLLACWDPADLDDDGAASVTDAIRLLDHLFLGGSPPAPPFPACGPDPTADELGCQGEAGCDQK